MDKHGTSVALKTTATTNTQQLDSTLSSDQEVTEPLVKEFETACAQRRQKHNL